EAVGLSGMTETPVVIYLGMRPGPAVGLPTRTAQEDLDLALYSGPGEFARAIYAPGKLEDAYHITQTAFDLAEKYQIPVFILSDQYLADLYYNFPEDRLRDLELKNYVVETKKGYKRYQLTPEGISPRGIPGYGHGLVVVDSDEHDEEGHITENLEIRAKMVEKRYHKLQKIEKEVMTPELYGSDNYQFLLLGWGSTYHPLREALEEMDNENISLLHFQQVYPLHPNTRKYLEKAQKTIIFENNIKSQFANLIKLETGLEVDKKILKYNGMPFSVEEIIKNVEGELE
ncbi:MAG TPA: 2-oxoacid:acceptor oxidoreductase subunit alpha, partial [Methanobacteriaceae archaeon]|nr:2-oxoacid:acceptor oxidoreductase subunit alpha [Methanobacteriaceae archaeon]